MKIAVTFLLLGISSFIETSNGLLPSRLNPLPKDKVQHHVRCLETVLEKVEILKKCDKCPEQERKTREKCLAEDLMHNLKMLALDLGSTLEFVLDLMDLELPFNALNSLKLGDVTSLVSERKVDTLLSSVTRLLEALLANIGCLLEDELITLVNSLGSTVNVLGLNLHKSLEAVTTSLTGTVLGTAFGLVGSLLGPVEGILG